jgi:beta-lactamase superfamily II metal-dependent hydrolase
MSRVVGLVLVLLMTAGPAWAKGLQIFFIDVEGGQSTLVVTPDGQSLLIDAGYGRGTRDPDRIMAAIREAGLTRIDYLMVTHFHGDHVGGIPELAKRIPIVTFLDYGAPRGTVYGPDRMSARSFAQYEQWRNNGGHHVPRPGEQLALGAFVDATFVTSGGALLSSPLPGAGQVNDQCGYLEDHPEDGTENFRSLGIVLRYGAFSFVDVGDVSGNTLPKLVCPRNLLGAASVYLIAHHGNYDSNSSAMYEALRPRVAVMNNGATKGGDPETVKTVRARAETDLWQLHLSTVPGAVNGPEELIANLDERDQDGHWIRLVAQDDGSFAMTNGRTGLTKTYETVRPFPRTIRAD